jgi:6,7-dimethyl-8-ribityllumazine synthase
VPGALEIPLALKAMADSGDFDALVALGCVIRGETYHFELVCQRKRRRRHARGAGPPAAGGQRDPDRRERAQAWARAEEKGRDAARVAVEMANLLEDLS